MEISFFLYLYLMKSTLRHLCMALGLALTALPSTAKIEHLLPKPQQITAQNGTFALGRSVKLIDASNTALLKNFLLEQGCSLADDATTKVEVRIDASLPLFDYNLAGFPAEGYRLSVSENAILITAKSQIGVIRAAQTLGQLAQGYEGTAALECVEVEDYPAFKVRGYMHDVGRSFISFEELKKQIDLLARFKVNVFHWHLTENQAWRFEVKAYPQLTSYNSMTRFPGKYYTQAQATELEAYAAERGVTIIPEIDMPGHSEAFVRAMGFDMQTDQGVEALKNILDEVAAVFPNAPYLHIGADEKTITYPNFLETMIDKVHSLGRKVVVWNPIYGVTVSNLNADMTQMWSTAGKLVTGRPNIDCRYNYTNHFDVFADLVGIYKSNIYYAERGNPDIAGTISAPWNDRKLTDETQIIAQNNFYANMIASAERGWIGGGKQYIEKGGTNLPAAGEEFEEFSDWERRFLFHKATTLAGQPIPYVKQTNVRWRITEAFPNNGDSGLQLPPETEGLKDSYTYQGKTYTTSDAMGAGIYLRHTWGHGIMPTHFASSEERTTAYAWTYVYSPIAQEVGAQIEFFNYGRSEKDWAPDRGKWDRYGSRIWLNDVEIAAPVWLNSGQTNVTNETLLRNENFTARKPTKVSLKQGWNKVFLKLPYNPDGRQRLKKWIFTFVLTDLEGQDAVEGLVYSPSQILDEKANQLSMLISEAQKEINLRCGTQPGTYSLEAAAELMQVIQNIEATYNQTLTDEQRAEQVKNLATTLDAFKANYTKFPLTLPKTTTAEKAYGYHLSTPQRGGYVLESKGVGQVVVGSTTVTNNSIWTFVDRNDGTFDLQNYMDKSYIAPTAAHNTALSTTKAQPTKGWTLKPAATAGLFIITSGSVQFNQTNPGLGQKLYNWGDGTNLTDTGCQFLIRQVEPLPADPTGISGTTASTSVTASYDLLGRLANEQTPIVITTDGRKRLRR